MKHALWTKRALLFIGLWPGRVSSNVTQRILILHVVTCFVTGSGIVNFVWNHRTNLALATKGFGIAVGMVTMLLKVLVFVINWDSLLELHDILDINFRKDLMNPELRPILLAPLNFFYRTTFTLSLLTWLVVIIFFITPPMSVIIQLAHNISPIQYRLPFPTQYPWNVTANYGLYTILYMIEICGGLATAGIAVSTDALLGFYIFQMSSQFRTLSHRMNNLKATDDYRGVIEDCATRHRTLMYCRDHLERVFGPIVLWMMLFSALIICGNIFQSTKISFAKAMLVMVHAIMKLAQTFLYGWYGTLLSTESESFRDSVYFSGWPGTGERSFMTDVCIMLMYKPLVLTACHFSVISMDMFIAVGHDIFRHAIDIVPSIQLIVVTFVHQINDAIILPLDKILHNLAFRNHRVTGTYHGEITVVWRDFLNQTHEREIEQPVMRVTSGEISFTCYGYNDHSMYRACGKNIKKYNLWKLFPETWFCENTPCDPEQTAERIGFYEVSNTAISYFFLMRFIEEMQ